MIVENETAALRATTTMTKNVNMGGRRMS